MRIRIVSLAGTFLVSLFVLASVSQAVPTLEYDFRVDQNASYTIGGLNPGGTLGGGATVNTGVALGTSTHPKFEISQKLQNGYMTIADRGIPGTSTTGDYMDTAARYSEIFAASGNNFGSGTFVTVIRPDFGNPAQRQWFMTHTAAGGARYIGAVSEGSMRVSGGRNTENAFGLFNPTVGSIPWDNGDWYMIATSWEQSSSFDPSTPQIISGNTVYEGLPDGRLRSYVRKLTSGGVLTPDSEVYFASDDAARVWHSRYLTDSVNGVLTLGNRRGFTNSNLNEGGTGDYALFQFYNTTFEQNDFDALFTSFLAPIPEPSSLTLSALGCLMMIRGSRRKRRLSQN